MPIRKPSVFVPPGGALGFGSQTLATQTLLRKKRPTKRRKAARKKTPVRKRAVSKRPAKRRASAVKKPARMVKGSAAAKRHMTKLRNMRKR